MLTVKQAKELRHGQILHDNYHKNSNGSCAGWRVNGKVMTWKRDSDRVEVPLKHGLHDFFTLSNCYLNQFHTEKDCPRNRANPSPSAITCDFGL